MQYMNKGLADRTLAGESAKALPHLLAETPPPQVTLTMLLNTTGEALRLAHDRCQLIEDRIHGTVPVPVLVASTEKGHPLPVMTLATDNCSQAQWLCERLDLIVQTL